MVARFGVTIYFGSPDKKAFQEIVRVLAKKNGINMPEEQRFLRRMHGNCLMAVCLEEQHSSLLIIWQDGSNALCGRLLESNRAWKME